FLPLAFCFLPVAFWLLPFETATWLLPTADCLLTAFSFFTSVGFLSVLIPLKIACLIIWSCVHSWNFISQINFGFTQVAGILVFGRMSRGHFSMISGCNFSQTSFKVF